MNKKRFNRRSHAAAARGFCTRTLVYAGTIGLLTSVLFASNAEARPAGDLSCDDLIEEYLADLESRHLSVPEDAQRLLTSEEGRHELCDEVFALLKKDPSYVPRPTETPTEKAAKDTKEADETSAKMEDAFRRIYDLIMSLPSPTDPKPLARVCSAAWMKAAKEVSEISDKLTTEVLSGERSTAGALFTGALQAPGFLGTMVEASWDESVGRWREKEFFEKFMQFTPEEQQAFVKDTAAWCDAVSLMALTSIPTAGSGGLSAVAKTNSMTAVWTSAALLKEKLKNPDLDSQAFLAKYLKVQACFRPAFMAGGVVASGMDWVDQIGDHKETHEEWFTANEKAAQEEAELKKRIATLEEKIEKSQSDRSEYEKNEKNLKQITGWLLEHDPNSPVYPGDPNYPSADPGKIKRAWAQLGEVKAFKQEWDDRQARLERYKEELKEKEQRNMLKYLGFMVEFLMNTVDTVTEGDQNM